MNVWKPRPSPARYIFLGAVLVCLLLAIWLWSRLGARAAEVGFDLGLALLGLALFLAPVLAGMLGYLAWCAFTMRYTLDRTHLRLHCGPVSQVIPLADIVDVHGSGDLFRGKVAAVRWRSASGLVPGYIVGEGHSPQLGRVVAVSTVPAPEQVLVTIPGVTFGLSPQNSLAFIRQLNERRDLDISAPEMARTEVSWPVSWGATIWSDRFVRSLFLAGLILNALLFFYLSLVYGDLPVRLPLHWNAQAQIDRIGDPDELLRLPAFALAMWLANVIAGWLALSRERAATLFLLAGAVAVQVVFAAGVVSIVGRAI